MDGRRAISGSFAQGSASRLPLRQTVFASHMLAASCPTLTVRASRPPSLAVSLIIEALRRARLG